MYQLLTTLLRSSQRNNTSLLPAVILITMILNITNRKLVYSNLSGAFTITSYDWQLSYINPCTQTVITCGTKSILFLDNAHNSDNSLITKKFDLFDPHYQVTFSFKFWRIDIWNNQLFQVFADQQIKYQRTFSDSDSSTNICNDASKNDEVVDISITLNHNSPSIWIILKGQGFCWGISDFELSIDECAPGCDTCSQTQCLNQQLVPITLPWITSDMFTTKQSCFDYLFEYTCGTYMKMEIDLDAHIKISSKIRFFLINTNTYTLTIKIDDQLVTTQQYLQPRITWTIPICNHIQILDVVITDLLHTNPKIKIRADITFTQFDSSITTPFFGISDFELFITNKYIDSPFEGCQLDISQFIEGCAFCVRGVCLYCQEGWYYTEQDQKCSPICGDFKLVQNEECDDSNLIPYDGCKKCIQGKCIECEQNLQLINGLCLLLCDQKEIYSVQQYTGFFNQIDIWYYQHASFNQDSLKFFFNQFLDCNPQHYGIFEFNYNQFAAPVISFCKNQSWDICLECKDGFQLTLNKQQCISVCNDGQIVDFEECDDSNGIQFDGCYKCQLSCQLECKQCVQQQCFSCIEGWQIINYRCFQICGDGLIALNSIEQCDDANSIQNDGCFECQLECVPNCLTCLNNQICAICQNYFQLEGKLCLPICGDGIIIPEFEDCDDGNTESNDGCYQCQFQCLQGCLDCEKGLDCKKCDSQYILNNETAQCQEIQSENDQNIDEIENTQNIICSKNFVLIDYQCVNQCGNGILNLKYEQCDDGNQIGGDGCSFYCFEEDSYECQNHENSTSMCSYVQPPDFMLYRLSSQTNDTQIIELKFTQKVKLLVDLSFEDIAVVFLIPKTNEVINIKPIVKLSTTFDHPIYQIFIKFRETINDPVLQINLAQSTIINENNLDLKRNELQVSLGNPFVLSESTQQKVTQIVLLNDGMIYSMISISGLSLLSGNALMFFTLLDLLQSLSYMKFMQYSFPPHLIQFLNTFTKVSLKPILDYFRIDEILSYFNGGSIPFQSKKSHQNQLNPLNQFYLLNAKSCYFSIIISLITYFICRLLVSQRIENLHQVLYQKFKSNKRYLLINRLFSQKIQKSCLKFKNEYFSFGVFKVYLAILHQFLFSILLQFPNYSFDSPLMAFNSINAIIGLVIIVFISLQLLSITSTNKKDKNKWLYFYQDTKSEFWAANYKSFQIYRITFYIFTIVVALDYPQIQSILLSMSSSFYLIYLIKFKPLQSSYEYTKLISREVLFILITGSFLIYSFEFDQNKMLFYGWIHIALFSLILISNLIIDLIECINKAWQNYKSKQELQNKKKIKPFYIVKINQQK